MSDKGFSFNLPGDGGKINVNIQVAEPITIPIFKRIYDFVKTEIDYDPAWIDPQTRSFRISLQDPKIEGLKIGEYAKCMDDSGRKVIWLATRLGPLVVQQMVADERGPLAVYADKRLVGSSFVPIRWHYGLGQPEGWELIKLLGWNGGKIKGFEDDDALIRRVNIAIRIEIAFSHFTVPGFDIGQQERLLNSWPGIS